MPTSTGPLARLAELVVSAPEAAPSGELLRVSMTIRVRSAGPRVITTPGTSALLVVSGERVVARADGASDAGAAPLILRAGAVLPAQAVPGSVRLDAHTGGPLRPGQYGLVAVLGYRNDSLNTAVDGGSAPPAGGRAFVLVSAPVPLEVRAC